MSTNAEISYLLTSSGEEALLDSSDRRKIVRDSEWMSVCAESAGTLLHESKFLTQGLEVSADYVKERWNTLSLREKYEFAQAFQAKVLVTPADEEILNFLMDVGDYTVAMFISPLLPRHREKERVLKFLLARIEEVERPKANFYQAIELLADKEAIPSLQKSYDQYKDISSDSACDRILLFDLLQCCRALWILENSGKYAARIEDFKKHPDSAIRNFATMLLSVR